MSSGTGGSVTGKTLTLESVFLKSKTDKINSIVKLNLWGSDLEDVSCLSNIPNLEVLSLAVNKIKTLKTFSKLVKLKELYLRKNNISSFKELEYLSNCQDLKKISLNENPIEELPNYRENVIRLFPQLVQLDEKIITPEERLRLENSDTEGYDDVNFETFNAKNKGKSEKENQTNLIKNISRDNREIKESKSRGKYLIIKMIAMILIKVIMLTIIVMLTLIKIRMKL